MATTNMKNLYGKSMGLNSAKVEYESVNSA